jgi:hypothetical protein
MSPQIPEQGEGDEVAIGQIWSKPHYFMPMPSRNLLDPIVRVPAILYMEELLPEPHTLNPYHVPFSLMNYQMRVVLGRLQERLSLNRYNNSPVSQAALEDDEDLASLETIRPVLLWASVITYAVANAVSLDPISAFMSGIDHVVYQDLVAILVSGDINVIPSEQDIELLPEGDLEMCKLLPVEQLGSSYNDTTDILRQIVADHHARVALGASVNAST